MKVNIRQIKDNLKRPIILDGAMGTLLIEKGVKPYRSLWTTVANITNWELVKQIHSDYISAGAEIITTNTFNSNPHSVKSANFDKEPETLVMLAVKAAYEAREDKDVIIAGCNAPAEDCYQEERKISFNELEYNHKKHIELLWEAGAEIIWNETQSHLDEIGIIANFCEVNELPYVINLYFTKELKLLSGESVDKVVRELLMKFPAIIIGFNCISPKNLIQLVKAFPPDFDWGFYMNCGKSEVTENKISGSITPEEYVNYSKKIINETTLYIGSCCGSTPLHTEKIKEYLSA